MDSEEIKNIVLNLRKIKSESFKDDKIYNFRRVKENCRISDLFLISLYFIWDRKYHKDLEELNFEKYLLTPYNRFIKDYKRFFIELYSLLLIDDCIFTHKKKPIKKKLLILYREVLLNV